MYDRWYAPIFQAKMSRPYVHLMFGARQTGKSTLLRAVLPPDSLMIDLSDPGERSKYLSLPGEFIAQCRAIPASKKPRFVFVDEVQNVPALFDAVQSLYDGDKRRWRFVLCGSSARKLRKTGTNLLPGRAFIHHLYPLILPEHPGPVKPAGQSPTPLELKWAGKKARKLFPPADLVERLAWGALPGIVTAARKDKAELLKAYAIIHLEEEIRREALVKDWGAFLRFLQFAAIESGKLLNYASISREIGISIPTIKGYYQLLEDMFVGFRVTAFTKSVRKNLLSTPKFLFFDLGVRNAAAGLKPSPDVVRADPGPLFEQWVGIELWKRLQYLGSGALTYQRTRNGAEIDFIIRTSTSLIPVEVKWTEHPSIGDARHLITFLREHPKQAKHALIVCRCPHPLRLHDQVTAIPWYYL
jgi:predicted AAA+ superfamily ATPase